MALTPILYTRDNESQLCSSNYATEMPTQWGSNMEWVFCDRNDEFHMVQILGGWGDGSTTDVLILNICLFAPTFSWRVMKF